jgi:hypothetical protein
MAVNLLKDSSKVSQLNDLVSIMSLASVGIDSNDFFV